MRLEFFGIDELNFVEFNTTSDDMNFYRLNGESKFINSEVFNLFAHCFEESNELYEYYEPTKFNARKIVVLRNNLVANYEKLCAIKNQNDFVMFIDSIFMGKAFLTEIERLDADWVKNWDNYFIKIKEANQEMISIVERCIDEIRVLWVIGY